MDDGPADFVDAEVIKAKARSEILEAKRPDRSAAA